MFQLATDCSFELLLSGGRNVATLACSQCSWLASPPAWVLMCSAPQSHAASLVSVQIRAFYDFVRQWKQEEEKEQQRQLQQLLQALGRGGGERRQLASL